MKRASPEPVSLIQRGLSSVRQELLLKSRLAAVLACAWPHSPSLLSVPSWNRRKFTELLKVLLPVVQVLFQPVQVLLSPVPLKVPLPPVQTRLTRPRSVIVLLVNVVLVSLDAATRLTWKTSKALLSASSVATRSWT